MTRGKETELVWKTSICQFGCIQTTLLGEVRSMCIPGGSGIRFSAVLANYTVWVSAIPSWLSAPDGTTPSNTHDHLEEQ